MEPIKRGRKNLPKGIKREITSFKFDPSTKELLKMIPDGQKTQFVELLIHQALEPQKEAYNNWLEKMKSNQQFMKACEHYAKLKPLA